MLPFPGSPASAAPGTVADPLDPGDNFAAALSYGDVTIAGYGTTTYVCDGRALAFGHPFGLLGDVTAGANAANAIAIVDDPFWGPYKLATAAESLGVFDQDRLAGIRATLGPPPTGAPVRSSVAVPATGASRSGETEVFAPELMGMATFFHVISNVDSIYDAIGGGTATVSWTLEGTRANGAPWRLERSNLLASEFDVAAEAADAIAMEAEMLAGNGVESARVTSVDVQASIDRAVRRYTLAKVYVSKNGGPFRARRSVAVRPGTRLRVRTVLRPFQTAPRRKIDFSFRVPVRRLPFGMLEIGGGGMFGGGCGDDECEFGPMPGAPSFDALLRALARAERDDDLTARLRTGRSVRVQRERRVRLDGVVVGGATIQLRPVRGAGGGPTPVVP